MEINKKLYLKVGLGMMSVVGVYMLAAVVVPKTLVTLTKAAPAKVISLADSRVLGEKLLAKADGKDKCVVNVYLLDKSAKGVEGKVVMLTGVDGISPTEVKTDENGKATFNIVSAVEGQFQLIANVGGSPLPREIKVTFRN